VYSFYGHFATVMVDVGDMVTEGTVIGAAGDSGWAPPGFSHLHYEEWQGFLVGGGSEPSPGTSRPVTDDPRDVPAKAGDTAGTTGRVHDQLRHDGGCNPNGPTCITHFVDVLGKHTFCDEIEWMVESASPPASRQPLHPLDKTSRRRRGLALRLAGSPTGHSRPGFRDIPKSHLFYDEVAWAVSEGSWRGSTTACSRTAANVSRQAFMPGCTASPAHHGPFPSTGLSDVVFAEPFFTEVSWGVQVGLIEGYERRTFRVHGHRRQAGAAFLFRFEDL